MYMAICQEEWNYTPVIYLCMVENKYFLTYTFVLQEKNILNVIKNEQCLTY